MPMPSRAIATATSSERLHPAARRLVPLVPFAVAAAALFGVGPVAAQVPTQGGLIYRCVESNGKVLTSDRSIPECSNREQRILNPDGSLNRVQPPTPTAEEQGVAEARDRQALADAAARRDAERRDRNLMQRYPDEAAHRKGRAKALDDVANAVRISEARITLLTAERKPLLDEAEFYVGKPMPSKLKLALDANDASLEAQKSLALNQKTEEARINALYDVELARLRKLWAGAPAGSLGPPPGTPAPAMLAPANTVSVPGSAAKPVGDRVKSGLR